MSIDPRRPRDLYRIIAPLTYLTTIIETHGTAIAANLAAWESGPASPSLDTGRTPIADDGSTPGPTPHQATTRDPINIAARELARHLEHAARSAETAGRIARSLLAIHPELAALLADRTPADRSGSCAVCSTYVANTPNDRIRAGRCTACYRWRLRHHGQDRPRSQWSSDTPGGVIENDDPGTPAW
jgi:hypothetical protein